ncbi:hypothetical protein [Rhodopila globiformis]|uniref:Uncharacterized protein n=1 Tax=Rhodopila globiformis TaxID=1071 RepID=A0A2S6MXJ2_RHOGL|nr:hypothetical protein [Rhodopila globiformis]PPQ27080.1 hypothetical protein CCS01_28510 [Rhodopila globiformis]
MDIMATLAAIPGAGPVLPYVTAVIAVCAALATVLPHPAAGGNSLYRAFYAAVNFIAFNVGKARNAAPSAPTQPAPKS